MGSAGRRHRDTAAPAPIHHGELLLLLLLSFDIQFEANGLTNTGSAAATARVPAVSTA